LDEHTELLAHFGNNSIFPIFKLQIFYKDSP